MQKRTLHCIALSLAAVIVVMVFTVPTLSDQTPKDPAPSSNPDNLVAKVNGQPIYEEELTPQIEVQLRKFRRFGAQDPSEEMLASLKRKALDRLIAVELLHQASRDLPIPDLEQRVDKRMEMIRKRHASGLQDMDKEEIRQSVRRQIHVKEYLKKNHLLEPEIPEAEIQAYYEANKRTFASKGSYRARHIICTVDPDGTAAERKEARRKIEEARQLILEGEPFEEVAKEYSHCNTASAGGDLGPREKGFMPPEFESVVFSLDPGELSPVIETEHGYHILEVIERTPEGTIPSYAETRDFIAAFLRKEAAPRRIADHVQKLRQEADVEVFLE